MNRMQISRNCIGCGICESIFPQDIKMIYSEEGYIRPDLNCSFDIKKLTEICPVIYDTRFPIDKLWGQYKNVFSGHSNDLVIRKRGSSGGVITAVLCWLLKTKRVDAVLEIGVDKQNPLRNKAYICKNIEEVLFCSGSRYAPAAPLSRLKELLDQNERVAIVGKPCDIRAVRKYMDREDLLSKKTIYLFSFFCAGTPSEKATLQLVNKLGANNNKIEKITYRGNGWPGETTVIDDKDKYTMNYESAWGGILGRTKQQFCRICADGTGECADISCGDCWFLSKNNEPSFKENDGRNLIFTRTEIGEQIIKEAFYDKIITLEDYDEDLIKYIQPYQFQRKTTLLAQVWALRLFKKYTPQYSNAELVRLSQYTTIKHQCKIFLGNIKRICTGKIK